MANNYIGTNALTYLISKIKAALGTKVDVVTGKSLTTNDLTDTLKTHYDTAYTHSQAAHAPSTAEQNVQSDWSEASSASDAYIKNKPTIPTVTNDLTASLKSNYDAAYTHSQAAHSPSDAEKNIVVTVKRNGTVISPDSSRAVNIVVPTKTSELTNDAGFLNTHQDISGKLATNGNASSVTVAATAASTKANITTGETLAVIVGKLMKWFTSFGGAAWLSVRTASGTVAAGNHTHTYTASQVGAIATSARGTANGVASLDADGLVPSSQLPSFVDDVIEGYYDATAAKMYSDSQKTTVITGVAGKIYVDITPSSNISYRWSGTVWTQITSADMVEFTNAQIDTIWTAA